MGNTHEYSALYVSEGDTLFIEFTTISGRSMIESLDNIRSVRPLEDGCIVEPKRGNSYAIRENLYEVRTKLAAYRRLVGAHV